MNLREFTHFLLILVPLALVAQETRAILSGTISDASGAIVTDARIRLTNRDTAVAFDAVSNKSGQYRFLFLNPGKYRLSAEKAGFKGFVRDSIELNVGQSAVVDVALQVGQVSDSVTISGEAPLLDVEKADRGLVMLLGDCANHPGNCRDGGNPHADDHGKLARRAAPFGVSGGCFRLV